jgi:hypothetical protein
MGGMFLFTIFNCVVIHDQEGHLELSLVVLSYFNAYSRCCYELFMASPWSFNLLILLSVFFSPRLKANPRLPSRSSFCRLSFAFLALPFCFVLFCWVDGLFFCWLGRTGVSLCPSDVFGTFVQHTLSMLGLCFRGESGTVKSILLGG